MVQNSLCSYLVIILWPGPIIFLVQINLTLHTFFFFLKLYLKFKRYTPFMVSLSYFCLVIWLCFSCTKYAAMQMCTDMMKSKSKSKSMRRSFFLQNSLPLITVSSLKPQEWQFHMHEVKFDAYIFLLIKLSLARSFSIVTTRMESLFSSIIILFSFLFLFHFFR